VNRGAGFTVTDTTTNRGKATAGASTTGYYLSSTQTWSSAATLLGGRSVPSLAQGAKSSGSVQVTVPSTASVGSYYVIACADDLKTVVESNESNNCRASSSRVAIR
jgi:subtilase family serine protease